MLDEQRLELRTIEAIGGSSEERVFFCATCDEPATRMFGAKRHPTPTLTYLLYCPKCKKVLGSWDSREQQERELLEFSQRAMAGEIGHFPL